jgi:hypothetical protein
MRSSTVYLARNVVNAPELKARIIARSRERGDTPEIAAWLQNHFYRYLVGNLQSPPEAVQAIPTTEALQQRYAAGAPAWALALLARKPGPEAAPADTALWWISPAHQSVLALERQLLEFLQSRQGTSLEGKLARINWPVGASTSPMRCRRFGKVARAHLSSCCPAAACCAKRWPTRAR